MSMYYPSTMYLGTKKIFAVWMTAALLLSLSYPIVAQDSKKEIFPPTYKIKLALSNLPLLTPVDPISIIKHSYNYNYISNMKQASLKITSDNNLLVSFFTPDKQSLQSTQINPAEENNQSLAYNIVQPLPPIVDKAKWDKVVQQSYKNGIIKTVVPGVKHIVIKKYTKRGIISINVLEINPALNSNISIEPALAGTTLANKKKVSAMVKENKAIAGINATFFKPSNGIPLGTMIINQELVTGPVYNRVTLGIKDNKFAMARISLQGKLISANGTSIKIDNVNQPRMSVAHNILYSYKWGKISPITPKYGLQVCVDNGKVVEISKKSLLIPKSGFVLVGTEKSFSALKVNDQINISFSTTPNWTGVNHAVSGGPYLIKDGQIFVDTFAQKFGPISGLNPRTAVGYTKDNRFIMITVDGRQKGSIGLTLNDLAKLMKEFGCYNAMNFDGGSSTQMYVNNKVVNNPLNKGGNMVGSGLIVKVSKNEV